MLNYRGVIDIKSVFHIPPYGEVKYIDGESTLILIHPFKGIIDEIQITKTKTLKVPS